MPVFGSSSCTELKNRHVSVMEITAWTVEQKITAIYRFRLKLHHVKKKPYAIMDSVQKLSEGSMHIWKGTVNAERYIQVLDQHVLPYRHRFL